MRRNRKRVFSALLAFVLMLLPIGAARAAVTKTLTEEDREYDGPTWEWSGYESATATFTAKDDPTYTVTLPADTISHMTTVEPDCEYPGIVTYTASVTFLGKTYYNDKNREIAKRDHEWIFDEFVWTPNEKDIYKVVAHFHCARYESHSLEFIPIAGMAEDPATCTEDGCTHYVAYIGAEESPDGQEHDDSLDVVIPAHGHQWSAPDYERIETETGYDVYAIVRCYYDYSHRIEETVHATFEVITPPTLYEEGLGQYTADFTDEHLWDIRWEEAIPKLKLALYGESVSLSDVTEFTDDGTLCRYDVKLRNVDESLAFARAQGSVAFDDALTFVGAKTDLSGTISAFEQNGAIAFVWATDGEGIAIPDGTAVISLYFKRAGTVQEGYVFRFRFTDNDDYKNGVVYLENGTAVDAEQFETVDGSVTFETPLYGDANCDGRITAADAAMILRAMIGLSEFSGRGRVNANVNGDAAIAADDAVMVLRYVVKLIDTFEAAEK